MNLIPVPLSGGVNLLADPRNIRDDELCYAKNLVPTKLGLLSKRGVAKWSLNIDLDPIGNPVAFAFSNLPSFDFAYAFLSGTSGTLCAGSFGAPYDQLATFDGVNDWRPQLIAFDNKMYCLTGETQAVAHAGKVIQEKATGGLEIADFDYSTTQSTFRAPRVAAAYKRRMAYANFGPGYENVITFSDADDPAHVHQDFLASNGKHIRLPVPSTDGIVVMIEIAQQSIGTPMQTALLVLCQFSAFVLTGEMLQTTEIPADSSYSGSLDVNQVNEPCGCASLQTLVRTQYGVVWTGPDDVWVMNTGSVPVRIGTKIRPAIERCLPDKRYLMHAEYHAGFYRLALCGDGQVPEAQDRMAEQWWLDLREGVPQGPADARWWGPQVYVIPSADNTAPSPGTFIMARDHRPGRANKLYSVTRGLSPGGTANAAVFVTLDEDGAYDSGCDAGDDTAPSREDGNEVAIELLTKEYSLVAPEQPNSLVEKIYLGCDVDIWTGEVCQLTTEIVIGSSFDEQSTQVDQKGFVLGVDALDNTRNYRTVQGVHIPRDPDTILTGRTYQLRLYDVPGWPVVKDGINNWFILTGGDGITFELVTLPDGFYADINEFCDSIRDACAGTNVFSHNQNVTPRGKVTLTHDDQTSYGYDVVSSQYVEGDAARSTRAIAAKLGFDDTDGTAGANYAAVHTAGEYVRNKLCAPLSIGGIVLRIEPSGRMPS